MKPNAVYSKSGKGVQEASGKTSLLKRGDRAVLSAIDGRATLAAVAKKVGKTFDASFQQLISQLDKDGFVREVTSGSYATTTAVSKSIPSRTTPKLPTIKPPAAEPSGGDLDFTSILPVAPRPSPQAAPKPAAADPVTQRAKDQEAALNRARQEAEARAQAERDRLRGEAEAKARSEMEAKVRAETERKVREEAEARAKADAEAKAKVAREAAVRLAAEAKAKAEAEAKAKIEAERKAREEAERKAREEAEQARREAEELRQRLEEERRAREEAERRAREEAERKAREEAERKAREEAERKAREEAEARRRKEEEDRRAQEELERMARESAAEDEHRRREEEERAQKALAETVVRQTSFTPDPQPAEAPSAADEDAVPGSLDALMADLDSFSRREEEDRRVRDGAEHQAREEKKRRSREESERRAREHAEQERREAEGRRRREEEERRAQEDAERRLREAESQRRRESEERRRKEFEAMAAAQEQPPARIEPRADDDIGVSKDDLGMDDVRDDEAAAKTDARKAERERQREARQKEREKKQREREARERAKAAEQAAATSKQWKPRRSVKWGRPVAMTLFLLLVLGLVALHIVPIPMSDYEDAAAEALGRRVKIESGRLSLITGVSLNLDDVAIGDQVKIAKVRAYPRLGSFFEEKKGFRRIELEGVTLAQEALGEVLFARVKGEHFNVGRIVVSELKLVGAMPLPVFEADAVIGQEGALTSATLRGPENLSIKLTPRNAEVEVDATASSFTIPFMRDVTLNSFAMKAVANRRGMNVSSWGGILLDGAVSGSANVRWSSGWQVDGVMTARGINAAVFAPALLSEGRVEGTAKFSLSGPEPAKLANAARIDSNFIVMKGVLGTFDLSRVLQTNGRQYAGRTPFVEMSGQGIYDRGAVALRNVNISAGALNAGASADIGHNGVLSGRIIADIKTTAQALRATITLGGTVKEPQVR